MKLNSIAKLLLAAAMIVPATQAISETRVTYKSAKSTSSYYQMAVEIAEAMKAGFQIAIHAIGDAGNREALDILEAVFKEYPATAANRHRIEHAQWKAQAVFQTSAILVSAGI